MVKIVTEADRQQWNDFVARAPAFALMQSYEWGEFKENLGWKAIRLAARRGGQIIAAAQLLIKPAPFGLFSVGYVPWGPLVDWEDETTVTTLLNALHGEARRHRAIFVKIEPPVLNNSQAHWRLQQYGFQASSFTNQPRATIILDLVQDLDDILEQMRKKTRQHIRRAAQQGITVRIGSREDLPAFCELMRITGRRGGFSPRSRDYYEYEWQTFTDAGQAMLFLAFDQDQLLAARMVFRFGAHAAEFHAGSIDNHRGLFPNYQLVWEAIKWAKAQGCRTYDLWGIPDEIGQDIYEGKDPSVSDRTDGLWGVYRFKSGFSKNIVFYAGAYDYAYFPVLYALITNRFFNESRMDRIAVWMDLLRST